MRPGKHVALGRLGLPPALLLHVLLLLQLLPPSAVIVAYRSSCPCANRLQDNDSPQEEHLIGTTTGTAVLNCCAHQLLAAHHPEHRHSDSFSIVWSFKGEEYKVVDGKEQAWKRSVSTFRIGYCGIETLESHDLRVGDDGAYRCLVTSNGAAVNKTFSLCLNWNGDTGSPPIRSRISEDTQALLREKVTFICQAYVGRTPCQRTEPNLAWTKERSDGSWVAATDLPHIDTETPGMENGVMTSHLTVHSVETEHFGRYRCTVTNHNGDLTLNVTLSKGVTSIVRVTGEYRAALVLMVAITVILGAAALLWRRCQVAFALHFRQKQAHLPTGEHQYDVFLVHGDSASHWVWSVLLPKLEDSFGYSCFLPQRDMFGGDMIIEEVAATVWVCRCVLVVVTPCLLENPWAAWALHHAVKAALQARTRPLALMFQDLKPQKGLPDTSGILDTLKHIRKIPVPRSYKCEDPKHKEDPFPITQLGQEARVHDGSNSLKVLRADSAVCRSRSKSPKNQRLSNMIAGSNMTFMDTSEDKNKRKNGGSVIFLERENTEEPGSPCQETPFILPLAAVGHKDRTTLALTKKKPSLSTFLSVLCVRDQQEMFWHTLLGCLGPPANTSSQEGAPSNTRLI